MCSLFAVFDHHCVLSTVNYLWAWPAFFNVTLSRKCGVRIPVFGNADSGIAFPHTRSPRLKSPESGVHDIRLRWGVRSRVREVVECGVRSVRPPYGASAPKSAEPLLRSVLSATSAMFGAEDSGVEFISSCPLVEMLTSTNLA